MSARPGSEKAPTPRKRRFPAAKRPPVRVARERTCRELSDAAVRRAVRAALDHGGRPELAVDVVLVGDRALAKLHARFLDDPTPTDVIAFELGDDDGGPDAEIYASVDCARARAKERGVAAARELALYLVHGALHLCGHDDHASRARARMRAAELRVMRALGYPDDPLPHP